MPEDVIVPVVHEAEELPGVNPEQHEIEEVVHHETEHINQASIKAEVEGLRTESELERWYRTENSLATLHEKMDRLSEAILEKSHSKSENPPPPKKPEIPEVVLNSVNPPMETEATETTEESPVEEGPQEARTKRHLLRSKRRAR